MAIKSALIVDDSQMARVFLKKQLESLAVSVQMVNSGEESIKFLVKNRPDVIFMDCLMPEMDGFSTTKKIIKNPDSSDIPIIMCTGKESEEDKDKALKSGAAGYLYKSSSIEPLQAILDKLNQKQKMAKPSKPVLKKPSPTKTVLLKDDINTIEKISVDTAADVAMKVANDIIMKQIATLENNYKNELNNKINSLTKQFEQEVIISVKTSLEYNQNYVDDKISRIDESLIPALKGELNDSIKVAITELKAELDQVDINSIIDKQIKQKTQLILENNLSTITSILSEHEVIHSAIKAKIKEQQTGHSEKIQSLETKITSKSSLSSNALSIIAFLLGASALAISLYPYLKSYFQIYF